jgi:hypothetical protein
VADPGQSSEPTEWATAGAPVDPAHPRYDDYQRVWRGGDWWTTRGYDRTFGQKLPALFERCGLHEVRAEASAEVVRGGSPVWLRRELLHACWGRRHDDRQVA